MKASQITDELTFSTIVARQYPCARLTGFSPHASTWFGERVLSNPEMSLKEGCE